MISGIVVLELATRVVILFNHTLEPMVPLGVGQFDPRFGWSLRPFSKGTSRRTGYAITYRINSHGLRDQETSFEKPDNIFRIVLLGDSNSFGYGVPIEKHFSMLLEGYFRNVEVINMGVSGFGVDQQLLFLREKGFRYHPDIVLAYVPHYANNRHMHTTRFGKEKPKFTRNEGQLVLVNAPVKNNSPIPKMLKPLHFWGLRFFKSYEIFCVNGYVFAQTLSSLFPWKPQSEKPHAVSKTGEEHFRKETYELGEILVNEMEKESGLHGATFVLVTKIEELHNAFLTQGKYSLNTRRALSNERLSIPNNFHCNESGNGVIAWEIRQFLEAHALIPRQYLQTHAEDENRKLR